MGSDVGLGVTAYQVGHSQSASYVSIIFCIPEALELIPPPPIRSCRTVFEGYQEGCSNTCLA